MTRFGLFRRGGIHPTTPVNTTEQDNYRTMYLVEFDDMTTGMMHLCSTLSTLDIKLISIVNRPVYQSQSANRYAYFIEIEGTITDESIKYLHKLLTGRRLPLQSRKARRMGSYIDLSITKIFPLQTMVA